MRVDKTTRVLNQLRSPPSQERRTAIATDMYLPNHSGIERYVKDLVTFEHVVIRGTVSQHALNVVQTTSGENVTALNLSSTNQDSSAVWITGIEDDKGTLKISHNKPTTNDANAAAISIFLHDAASACQGIFMDSDGSTGKMAQWRNNGVNKFVVESTGNVICTSLDPDNGASGSFTTVDGKTVTVTNGIITSIV